MAERDRYVRWRGGLGAVARQSQRTDHLPLNQNWEVGLDYLARGTVHHGRGRHNITMPSPFTRAFRVPLSHCDHSLIFGTPFLVKDNFFFSFLLHVVSHGGSVSESRHDSSSFVASTPFIPFPFLLSSFFFLNLAPCLDLATARRNANSKRRRRSS